MSPLAFVVGQWAPVPAVPAAPPALLGAAAAGAARSGPLLGQPAGSWSGHAAGAAAAAVGALLGAGAAGRRKKGTGRRPLRAPRQVVPPSSADSIPPEWQPGAQDDLEFASAEQYEAYLEDIGRLPDGFRVGNAAFKFVPSEAPALGKLPMRVTMICADEPTDAYAAVFTQNAFPGSPVLVGRERLKSGKPLQAVVVNNKVSNVCPTGDGVAASEGVCAAAAAALGLQGGGASVLPSSTGVIGWQLPTRELAEAMPSAVSSLQAHSAVPAARGIMTTDRFPKVSSVQLPGDGRIVGFAKGAGMIEPNMSTMLCYVLTDAEPPEGGRAVLQQLLQRAVDASFNACSVDGDESTSDTVLLLSSCRKPKVPKDVFAAALQQVCQSLAAQVVRNGEGTRHVIRVAVSGAVDDATAKRVGKGVVNGPLFKCAVSGNDPNVGRLVGKIGQVLGTAGAAMTKGCECLIGGETIFKDGRFALDGEKEQRLSAHFKSAEMPSECRFPPHNRVVDIQVRLSGGNGRAVVLGSDLTREYVDINGDYRS